MSCTPFTARLTGPSAQRMFVKTMFVIVASYAFWIAVLSIVVWLQSTFSK